jgi:glycosyltransferase involved in cell wall biosynthesis
MRVALIATLLKPDTLGGAEAYVDKLSRSLAARHDVLILTGSQADVDGPPVVRLPRLPLLTHGTGSAASRVVWHARDQWRLSVHRAVTRELRRFRPDVVSTHHPQGLSAAVFTGVAALRLPHVHTAHDLNVLCARTSMTRDGEYCGGHCLSCLVQRGIRGAALRADLSALIGVSRYICQRHVTSRVVPAERALTVRLGADTKRSRVRTPAGPPTLGFVGALSPHKGLQTLLAAFAQTDEPWRLRIAGAGPLTAEVEQAAREDPRISYAGYVDDEAKDAFYDELDLLVIPSEWEEPATLVAAEACVRGVPCVVSDRGGLPETPDASVFRAGDPAALVEALRGFTPERIRAASERLLADRDTFTWATHLARVERVLEIARDTRRPTADQLEDALSARGADSAGTR